MIESLFIMLIFMKIGFFCYGGGYAMMSFLQDYVVKYNWMSIKDFTEIVAISQITPGPIAVNLATFVGFKNTGVIGAILATFGIYFPCVVMSVIVSKFFRKFSETKAVKNIMNGIKPASAGLIMASAFSIGIQEIFSQTEFNGIYNYIKSFKPLSFIIFLVSFILLSKTKINPVFIVIASAFVGIFIF